MLLRYLYKSTLDGQSSIIVRVDEVKIDVHGGVPDNGVVQYISCDTNPFKSGDTNPMTFSYKHGNALKSDDMIHYIVERDDLCRKTRDLAIIEIMDKLEICTLDSATGKYVVYNKSWEILRQVDMLHELPRQSEAQVTDMQLLLDLIIEHHADTHISIG